MRKTNAVKLMNAAREVELTRQKFEQALDIDLTESDLFALLETLPSVLSEEMNIPEVSQDSWYECFWDFIYDGSTELMDEDNNTIIISTAEQLYDLFYSLGNGNTCQ